MKRKVRPTAAANARQAIVDRAEELKKSHGHIQLVDVEGKAVGPPLDISLATSLTELTNVVNELLQNEDPMPYLFTVDNMEVTFNLARVVAELGLSTEQSLKVRPAPMARPAGPPQWPARCLHPPSDACPTGPSARSSTSRPPTSASRLSPAAPPGSAVTPSRSSPCSSRRTTSGWPPAPATRPSVSGDLRPPRPVGPRVLPSPPPTGAGSLGLTRGSLAGRR